MGNFTDERFLALVSQEFCKEINGIPDVIADLSEPELKKLANPTPVDYALKTSFWREFQKSESIGGLVTARDVYGGVATSNYFKNHVLRNPYRLAWLCRPTQVYEREVESLLTRGTERLWELIEVDIYDDEGKLDVKKGYLVLDTIKMIEQRAKGLAVQRVQSVNLNIDQQRQKLQIQAEGDVDQRIKELEQQLKILPPATTQEIIDVGKAEDRVPSAT